MKTLEYVGGISDTGDGSDVALLVIKEILPELNAFIATKRKLKIAMLTAIGVAIVLLGTFFYILMSKGGQSGSLSIAVLVGAVACVAGTTVLAFLDARRRFQVAPIVVRKGSAPFTIRPFEDGAVLVDELGLIKHERLSYPELKESEVAVDLDKRYKELVKRLPPVLSRNSSEASGPVRLFDSELELRNLYIAIGQAFSETTDVDVELGVFDADDHIANSIVSTKFLDAPKPPESLGDVGEQLSRISGVLRNKSKGGKSVDIDDLGSDLERRIIDDAESLSGLRARTLRDGFQTPGDRLADLRYYAAYDFYCPYCHEEEVKRILEADYEAASKKSVQPISWNKAAKLRLIDWRTEVWSCPICERETDRPIPVHKLHSDIFLPVYGLLLQENEKDRLRIYSQLREKLAEYDQRSRKESEEIVRDVRKDIEGAQMKLESMTAQVESQRDTIHLMEELLSKIVRKKQSRLTEVEHFADEFAAHVREESRATQGAIEESYRSIESQMNREMKERMHCARIEEETRDNILRSTLVAMQETQANTNQIAKNAKLTAAIDLARAKHDGYDEVASWRLIERGTRFIQDIGNGITGKSDIEAANSRLN